MGGAAVFQGKKNITKSQQEARNDVLGFEERVGTIVDADPIPRTKDV